MARSIGKLSALAVERAKRPGLYSDGGGLYLQVSGAGAKSWLFRFMLRGRARGMGLGTAGRDDVSLAKARAAASECRELRRQGIDPIEARKGRREAARLDAAKAMSFADCAAAYIESHAAGWRNVKHAAQWRSTLKTYVEPVFGAMSVQAVDVGLVLKVLEPLWKTKPETASRLRGRIEAVLDWAAVRGYRRGENPARWRGHLDKTLPARSRVRQVQHHPALGYDELPAFMRSLREQNGTAARALEFLILTAARTGEAIGARWDEFDLAEKMWIVPATRIKGGRLHRVPLSDQAAAIVEKMNGGDADYVFPGGKLRKPLSNMALLTLLKRMGRADVTAHGFRSTFRDWASEQTNYPREAAEMALAHAVGDKVEAAYRRGDLFEKRRRLMDEWARHCASAAKIGKVIPMRRRART
jgi:integrase